jgi:PAS domain S-box-containing protein
MALFTDGFTPVNPAFAIDRNPLVAAMTTPLRVVIAQMQETGSHHLGLGVPQPDSVGPSIPPSDIEAQTSCVIVVEGERVAGIFTQRDVLRLSSRHPQRLQRALQGDDVTLAEVMSCPVITLVESAFLEIAVAIDLLQRHHIHHLPIVNERQHLTGLVTRDTLQQALLVHQLCRSHQQQTVIADIENRYANLVDTAPVGIFHTDGAGRYTYVNERWCEITRLQPSDALDLPWYEIVHPDDWPLVKTALEEAVHQQVPFRSEFRLQHRQQLLSWVYGQVVAERGQQGRIVGYVGTLTDISKHKQFEIALQKSDAQSRNILSLIPDYLFRIDTQGVYRGIVTYQGNISLVAKGINPVGRTMLDILPPAVAEMQMGYLQTALATGKLEVYEQQVDLGNQIRWEEVRVIKSGDDEALFMVRDISDRKQAEQALQALIEGTAAVTGEDFFPSLVRHIAAALQVDYALVSELRGKQLHTLAFWHLDQLRPPYVYNILGTPCEQVLEKGSYFCTHNAQHSFPEDLDLIEMGVESYLGVVLNNARGEPIGNLCILHRFPEKDLQQSQNLLQVFAARAAAELERQKATASLQQLNQKLEIKVRERTQALQQTNAELARATRLKDEFLANMSHELRTPLNAILGLAEALQEGVFGNLHEAQLKTLQTIESSGQHLLDLINDILDVAKIESGKMELHYSPTHIADLCRSSCMFVAQEAVKQGIKLENRWPDNLPPMMIDQRRMRQVLINLLSNAVKFTPPGGRVALTASYDPGSNQSVEALPVLKIAVADTGIGIAADKISRLFQPFEQIDSALNRQHQGTGLGLTLVQRIVALHGGQVIVTSTPGQGSCFTLELPCQGRDNSATQGYADPQINAANPTPLTSALILIAEDNEANITTMSGYLGARGYRIMQARNGREAIKLADTANPDLILMDIQMPEVDGLEAIRRIRQNPKLAAVPIVAITALAMASDCDRCLAAGADHYLAKPLKLKQLVTTIQQLLSRPHH